MSFNYIVGSHTTVWNGKIWIYLNYLIAWPYYVLSEKVLPEQYLTIITSTTSKAMKNKNSESVKD